MPLFPALILGSTTATKVEGSSTAAIMWLSILLVVVLVGGFVILAIRRRIRPGGDGSIPVSFNLATLREMKDRGELTESEFKKACEHLHRDAAGSSNSGNEG